MKYEIIGNNLQFVKIYLSEGEEVYAEAGKMMFKSPNVDMESKLVGGSKDSKLKGVLSRVITGESIFTTHFHQNQTSLHLFLLPFHQFLFLIVQVLNSVKLFSPVL